MKCPKCSSEDFITFGELGDAMHKCLNDECHEPWTDWQQSRIAELERRLATHAGNCRIFSDPNCDCTLCKQDKKIAELEARLLRAETGNYHLDKRLKDAEVLLHEVGIQSKPICAEHISVNHTGYCDCLGDKIRAYFERHGRG
jgi:hypothetical protein